MPARSTAAAVPAAILFVGCIFVPETPNCKVEQNKVEEARITLQKVRGCESEWPGG
jgi:hypothetical protein